MSRTLLSLIALVLLVTFVQAQETPAPDSSAQPKSYAAKQAEAKFDSDMRLLDSDYQQKAAIIKQVYVDGLKAALKNLAKSDNADPEEIAKLSAKIKEVQATVVAVPVATQQHVNRIFGRWKETWGAGNNRIRVFQKNATVTELDGTQYPWMQDGSSVIIYYKDGTWEHLTLSNNGKTMSGVTSTHMIITYTYSGD